MVTIKLIPAVKQADVLALLNLKPLDSATMLQVERYYADFVSLNSGNSNGVKGLLKRLKVSNSAEFELRICATKLRQHVDEWLRTGFSDDGCEIFEVRSLVKAPCAMKVLQDYLLKHNPRFRFLQVPPEVVVDIGSSEDPPRTRTIKAFVDPIDCAWRNVARSFFGLVTSDWGYRLCKCRYKLCGQYFVHPKPRRSYKHGTFCGDHQMAWTATQHVKERRHLVRSALLNFAAVALMKRHINGPHWQADRQMKIQLANDVSARIRTTVLGQARLGLTWVTRNRKEIEKHRLQLCLRPSNGGSVPE